MKKLLPFIIILSLIFPFFPSIEIFAFDEVTGTVSMDDILDDLGLVNVDGLIVSKGVSNFSNQIVNYLGQLGYVTRDNATDVVIDYLANEAGIPYAGSSSNSFNAQDVIDWLENNYSSSLSQNIINYSVTYAENVLPYYVYKALPVSQFISFLDLSNVPSSMSSSLQSFQNNLSDKVNNFNTLCIYYLDGRAIINNTSYLYSISSDVINDFSFYLSSGSFSIFPDYEYQIVKRSVDLAPTPQPVFNGRLWFSNGILPYSGSFSYFRGNILDTHNLETTFNFNIYCGGSNIPDSSYASFYRNAFLCPDSWGSYSFPVFKSNILIIDFYKGQSDVYKFDSDIDLGQFGEDIDYSKLYDLISSTVQGNTGNVIDSINNVANNYLQQQLDLLHDINNALNDGNGQSWLRRIYGILDYNFPLTLSAFQDLIYAVQNISVSGGGGDFSEATQVLRDIDTKLGILIDEPFTDLTDNDWNDMKSRIQTKFPFCIFSDIVAISVILNRPPQQPDLNFPVPIMGSESENMVHIDLSPYEHARPYVHGVLIFVFIIGLLSLSVKIFDHLKS